MGSKVPTKTKGCECDNGEKVGQELNPKFQQGLESWTQKHTKNIDYGMREKKKLEPSYEVFKSIFPKKKRKRRKQ